MNVKDLKEHLSQFPDDMELYGIFHDHVFKVDKKDISDIISTSDKWTMTDDDLKSDKTVLILNLDL